MTSNLDWALMYHRKGWIIHPSLGKEPHYDALRRTGYTRFDKTRNERVVSTNAVLDNPPDEAMITNWWTNWPTADIKVFTGKASGITVVDVDTHAGDKTYTPESVLTIVKELGVDTLSCTTGRRGKHLYFKYAPIRSGQYFEQVEVKNDGVSVNVPPSTTKDGIQTYAWDNPEMLLAQLPTIPELFVHKQKALVAPERFDALLIEGARQGARNQSSTELIGKLLQSLQMAFYDWEAVMPSLWEFVVWWNETKNNPPLTEKELLGIFKSVLRTDSRKKQYGRTR